MKYQILQLKNFDTCNYIFMRYSFAEKHNFSLDDYEQVYEDDVELVYDSIDSTLEFLFTKFNCYHPDDFNGHSMSTSDVIVLDNKCYYVDTIGFKYLEGINYDDYRKRI